MTCPVSIVTTVEPAIEPIDLAEALDHCRIDSSDSDTLLISLIKGAREYVENHIRRALINRTLDVRFGQFSGVMEMPKAPLSSVLSIKYVDVDGNEQTLDSGVYRTDSARDPGIVELGVDQSWPDLYNTSSPITIQIIAGYGETSDDVPAPIKQAMLLLIGHWFENRESTVGVGNIQTIPMGVDSLLAPYRVQYF